MEGEDFASPRKPSLGLAGCGKGLLPAKSSPQTLKRGTIFAVLAARVKLVPFPILLIRSIFRRPPSRADLALHRGSGRDTLLCGCRKEKITVMTSALLDLEPKEVWKHFEAFTKIPRASTKEAAAREYVLGIAKRLGLEAIHDKAGKPV